MNRIGVTYSPAVDRCEKIKQNWENSYGAVLKKSRFMYGLICCSPVTIALYGCGGICVLPSAVYLNAVYAYCEVCIWTHV